MTLHFATKPLRDAIATLQPVLASKATLPQLGAVEISVYAGTVCLEATSMDVWMIQTAPMKEAAEAVSFRVPGRRLHEALSRISSEELTITTTDSHAILTAGTAKLSLPLVVDELPALPDTEWGEPMIIDDLQGKLKRCLPFASREDPRPLLQAVHFGDGRMEAADGRRYICITDKDVAGGLIVPAELCQLIARTEGGVVTRAAKGLIEFAGDGWTITGKLLESQNGQWIDTSRQRNAEFDGNSCPQLNSGGCNASTPMILIFSQPWPLVTSMYVMPDGKTEGMSTWLLNAGVL